MPTSATAKVTLPADDQILITREFDAPRHLVYRAYTEPDLIRRWWAGRRGEATSVEVNLRVGGRIRIVMRDPADGTEAGATGEYQVVEPPQRLVFTWIWDDRPEQPQLIELEFSELDGRTTVLMTNSAILTDERLRSQERGWNVCYDNLERLLAG